MGAPFDSFNEKADSAVVVTVSHAGRDYPAGLAERLAVPFRHVRPLEDRYADLLVEHVVAAGHRVLIARTPRLMIDLNRGETDFTAASVRGARSPAPRPSHRARGGLGLVPDRLGNVLLWKASTEAADLAQRLAQVHRPWHMAVASALAAAHTRNGRAVLIDVHSMPPLPGHQAAQVVVGDRHSGSAAPDVTAATVDVFRALGLRVALNIPYAGAYTLDRHGAPAQGVSALQIEIDRRLYLDAVLDQPGRGLSAMQGVISALVARLANLEPATSWLQAAE